ncbi:MAG: hypothetical protein R3A79_06760 [Nannocystaceae bacterium]
MERRAQPRPSGLAGRRPPADGRPERAAPRLDAAALLLAALALACGDDATPGASATTGIGSLTEVTGAPTTSGDATSGPGETTTGAPQEPLCPALDVSLVMDPAAPIYNQKSRDALVALLDDLVLETGARVRLLANVGTEFTLTTSCLEDLGGGPILTWGEGFAVEPGAADALDCLMEAALAYTSELDGGAWMFSGLMFPILERPDWPDPEAAGLALLLSASDDQLGGMYSRAGMTSEAYIRLAGGGARGRVATLTFGDDADELHTFSYSLGARSLYRDLHLSTLAAALAAWTPEAVAVCADYDRAPEPPQAEGCKRIDILFVIDGSLSMTDEQRALAGLGGEPPVFADFTDALLSELTDVDDFHVGVVAADPGASLLHTHRDFPEQPESPETDCGLPPGQRWIVGPSPELAERFACIGATKAESIEEHTALSGALALHDPANAGFLRDDSLLFVVLITDEDTQDFSVATRVAIHDAYLEAVGGDPSRLIVLAIAGDQGVFEMPKTICMGPYGGAAPGRRLTSIVRSFAERGHTQDICAGSMTSTFEAILDDVVSACQTVTPIP